jgi:general secretion pathway protein D
VKIRSLPPLNKSVRSRVLCLALFSALGGVSVALAAPAQERGKGKRAPQPAAARAPEAQTAGSDPVPPGDAGNLPNTMDKIAAATDIDYRPKPGGYRVKFNLQDADLAELVNHISGMTGRRFIYGAKVRSIKATVVSPEPVTLDEAYQAFLSILEVNGMTVVPQGRFLKIVDSAGVTTQTTPVFDRGAPVPSTDTFVTRLYRTRFVSPDEAAPILLKFKSKDGDVSTYPGGNLLIITDTGSNINRMVRILEEIDVGGAGQQMWIEPINHGNANDLATRINDLFEVGQNTKSGISRVVADEPTNSLIIVGNEDSYSKLLQVLKKLDTRPGEAGRVHVLPLQHAVSNELAKTLDKMLNGQSGGKKGTPDPNNSGGMFEGDVSVTSDEATNSLVITSSPRDFAQLRVVVDKLDQARRQVFIEAVIMDVGVTDSNEIGVAWHGGMQQDLGGGGPTTFLGGFNGGKSIAFPADPTALQAFAAGVRGPDLAGTAGLTPNGISIPAFGVVLNALASSGRANVLATPHIIATDNVAAEIKVGENIPLQTNLGGGINAATAASNPAASSSLAMLGSMGGFGFNAQRTDVGNNIKVTPHINDSDEVRLEIEQESSQAGAPLGALGAIPITKRTASTTVVVADQQTVVIGGLMQESQTKSKSKVPILGDVPILGVLFSSTKNERKKTNLLLILTPHVIREQADLRRIFERKMQERQEFIDRFFVFATDNWKPPTDFSRQNGLVEEIRQAYFAVDEEERRESELVPREYFNHEPSDPIEPPAGVKDGGKGKGRPAAPKSGQNEPAPAPRPKSNENPLHISPLPRIAGGTDSRPEAMN